MLEIFKDVEGYEGKYQVSNKGRVKSMAREIKNGPNKSATRHLPEKILKNDIIRNGYAQVAFWKDGKKKNHLVHRLVAKTFLSNPQKLPDVNHIDENKINNQIDNLEWVSRKQNMNHGTLPSRRGNSIKGRVPQNRKMTEEDAKRIREYRTQGLKPTAIKKQMDHISLSMISHFFYGRSNQKMQKEPTSK